METAIISQLEAGTIAWCKWEMIGRVGIDVKGPESEDKHLILYVIKKGEPAKRGMTRAKQQASEIIFATALWMIMSKARVHLSKVRDKYIAIVKMYNDESMVKF